MIRDCMKREVVAVSAAATVREAARWVVKRRVGTLPVVDQQGVLVGVVRIKDLLKVFMPDFVIPLDNIDFVHDSPRASGCVPACWSC
jgi:CBS-domain-containing membrane protein